MRILLLNGESEPGKSRLGSWLKEFVADMTLNGVAVDTAELSAIRMKACMGCWTCWWATPGLCVIKDDMASLYPKIIDADAVVWAIPLVLGAQSALVKIAQDRMIPLVHPYMELVGGESHHRKRYERYPLTAAVVDPAAEDGAEDVAIVRSLFERFSLNMRSRLAAFATTDSVPAEAAYALRGY